MTSDGSASIKAPSRTLPFRGHLAAPHSAVSVYVARYNWGFHIEHSATADDLIACGAVTAEQLGMRAAGKCTKDSDGQKVRIRRRGKLIKLTRPIDLDGSATALSRVGALPGIEPWMLEAAECTAGSPQRGLPPEEWREGIADVVAAALNGAKAVVAKPEYRVDPTDLEAYARASAKAIDELTGLLRSMRTRQARTEAAKLRLVVDNSRPGAQP